MIYYNDENNDNNADCNNNSNNNMRIILKQETPGKCQNVF